MKTEEIEAEIVEENGIVLKAFTDLDLVEGIDLDKLLKEYDKVPQIDPEAENAGELYQYVLKGDRAFVKARNKIEKVRKILVSPALEYQREANAKAKELKEKIHDKEVELHTQRMIVEDNEQRKQDEAIDNERIRVSNITKKLAEIHNLPADSIISSSKEIAEILGRLKIMIVDEDFYGEYLQEAETTIAATIRSLYSLYDTKILAETAEITAKEAEEKRLKEEAIAKDRRDEENRRLASERKALEDERKAFEAEKRAKAEAEAKKLAEDEAELLAEEQELARRERAKGLDKEMMDAKKDAVNAITEVLNGSGFVEDVMDAIIKGEIPHVNWEYNYE